MQGSSLCRGARIGGLPFRIQTTLVTDAYGISVVMPTVCSHLFFGASLVDTAIPCDIVVITDIFEVPMTDMIVAAIFECVTMISTGGRTVDDDECYLSHDRQLIQRLQTTLEA